MHRWKFSLLATAAALSTGLYVADASALSLGRVTVQSALGEPLRAQVALPGITPAEADSLHISIASPEVFRSQGLEFSPVVNGIRLELKRGAGGAMTLQMSSNSAVNDPFIDLVIDAAWNAGHLVRSYTLLFDPPALRKAPAPAPVVAPQVSASPAPGATATPIRTPSVSAATPAKAPAAPAHASAEPSSPKEVKVQAGDTAGAIASAHRPSGISLDQMLVAMVRANPHAFTDGNANRLRSGTVLQLPSKEEAQATPAAEARRIIAAQSRDFNAYRQRLAGAAPAAQVETATRSASGKVQTEVAESKPTAANTDKLTLSKGSATQQADDAHTAHAKQAGETSARLKELSKNIEDLKDLSQGASSPSAAPAEQAPASAQAAPEAATANTSTAPAAAPAEATADSATTPPAATPSEPPAAISAPATPVTAPAAAQEAPPKAAEPPKAPPKPVAAPPAPIAEPSLLDSLTEEPLMAGGALALILLLLGWGGYRYKQSRRDAQGPETTFSEDADHPDSFFAESGGQEVDTTSSDLTTGSSTSTLYSPSQLDQIGDVDPVAEAEVYLAYGKDPEAEAILKEAAQRFPEQAAIQAKLADIYAKRQDRVAFEATARKVQIITHGQGADWERVRQMGAILDDDNPLYKPVVAAAIAAASQNVEPAAAPAPAVMSQAPAVPDSILPEINLDLDLDDGTATLPPTSTAPAPASAASNTFAAAAVGAAQRALDEAAAPSGLGELTLPDALPEESAPAMHPAQPLEHTLEFPTDDLALADSGPMPLTRKEVAPTQPASLATQPTPLEFNLGALSLDLGQPATATTPATAAPTAAPLPHLPEAPAPAASTPQEPLPSDPLATKLALAEEFKAIGDSEGARSLIEEVMAQAGDELKAKAKRVLDTLN